MYRTVKEAKKELAKCSGKQCTEISEGTYGQKFKMTEERAKVQKQNPKKQFEKNKHACPQELDCVFQFCSKFAVLPIFYGQPGKDMAQCSLRPTLTSGSISMTLAH